MQVNRVTTPMMAQFAMEGAQLYESVTEYSLGVLLFPNFPSIVVSVRNEWNLSLGEVVIEPLLLIDTFPSGSKPSSTLCSTFGMGSVVWNLTDPSPLNIMTFPLACTFRDFLYFRHFR